MFDSHWNAAPLRTLIRYIVGTHHAYLQAELPALDKLIGRLAQHEGLLLRDLQRAIHHLKGELELQMRKEETILFPAILELEARVTAGGQPEYSQFGSVANLSRVTAHDHEKAARAVDELRQLTNNYTCAMDCEPEVAALFARLASLARDLYFHIHLEKDILLPRSIALERESTQSRQIFDLQ